MTSIFYRLLKYQVLFIYVLFIGYLIFLHPSLLGRLSVASPSSPDLLLGYAFLLLPFLEMVGFWLKFPVLTHYARQAPAKRSNWIIVMMVFLPILHLGMSAFLFIIGTQIAGVQPAGDAALVWQLLYVAGFFLVIIKEAGFLLMFLLSAGVEWSGKQKQPPQVFLLRRLGLTAQEMRLHHLLENLLGDVLLLAFSTLGYSALWDYVDLSSPFYPHVDIWEYFLQLLGILIYFLMVIPSLQAVYLLQQTITHTTRRQKVWAGLQFAVILAAAFISIIRS